MGWSRLRRKLQKEFDRTMKIKRKKPLPKRVENESRELSKTIPKVFPERRGASLSRLR